MTQTTTLPTKQAAAVRNIAIARIRPKNYAHASALDDVVESFAAGLQETGYAVRRADIEVQPGMVNIMFGAHLLTPDELQRLPDNVILYNFEQVSSESGWMKQGYLKALATCRCWDYSRHNIRTLRALQPEANPRYVPVGYAPCLTRIEPATVQDIDVLFYGSINGRRRKILDGLKAAGLRVVELFGVYGKERDAAIARAKIVLNLHYYNSHVLEAVRLSYLMSNAKAIVSECAEDTEVYPHYRDGLALVPYDDLVETCRALVANEAGRQDLGRRALQAIQRVHYRDILKDGDPFNVSGSRLPVHNVEEKSGKPPLPAVINLGSGKDWRADCLNVDILPRVKPDWLVDICTPLALGATIATERFGDFTLEQGMFDRIIANDVLEHLPDLVSAMTTCRDLLCVGGQMHIHVPYDLSLGAWQDPTHVRAFNEHSWLYYTDWYWYLGWKASRFVVKDLECLFSPLGTELKQKGVPNDEILRTPRAIDAMRVVLEKIAVHGP